MRGKRGRERERGRREGRERRREEDGEKSILVHAHVQTITVVFGLSVVLNP